MRTGASAASRWASAAAPLSGSPEPFAEGPASADGSWSSTSRATTSELEARSRANRSSTDGCSASPTSASGDPGLDHRDLGRHRVGLDGRIAGRLGGSSPAAVLVVLAGLGALVHELLDDDQLLDDGQLATTVLVVRRIVEDLDLGRDRR